MHHLSCPAPTGHSSSSSSAAPSPKTPGTKPTRHRKSYGDYKALAPYLAKLPPITGYDEYDLRGVESEAEMIVGANYDYAREALRQALRQGVVICQALQVVLKRVARCRRQQARLAHAATGHLAPAVGSRDEFATAAQG